ncbi:hypothetical protein B0H66DRAFT_343018 [Apodospora peruviana]|uniref:Required for respiratory growth protein 9, mitochondrial n=1 Tax=Apodospora peruviana TaxID=516989 RepID=A0AAE0M1B4_9PEZI|nr:hypothetical protein B0H66DRAFT_343018 [Apodospora peruviana]
MNCSCRTAALRLFLRSITQIHVPTDVAARQAAARLPRGLTGIKGTSSSTSTLRHLPQTRTLYTTCARNNSGKSSEPDGGKATATAIEEDVSEAHLQSAAAPTSEDLEDISPEDVAEWAEEGTTPKPKKKKKDKKKTTKDAAATKEKTASEKANAAAAFAAKQKKKTMEDWQIQREALKKKFPEGWNPRKKMSPDAMAGIRALHQQFPEDYTTDVLAKKFEMSPEAIRRILRSKWQPTPDVEIKRQERWFNRGKSVWTRWAELGKKPPRRWRAEGIVRDPKWNIPRGPNTRKKRREEPTAEEKVQREMLAAERKLSDSLM